MQLKKSSAIILGLVLIVFVMVRCSSNNNQQNTEPVTAQQPSYGGFGDKVKWGEHLVTILDCGDCHTPKKMTAMGAVPDNSLLLSGHPSNLPLPDIDQKMIEAKGLVALSANDFTAFVGPWGVSFTANITSDSTTGIGSWTQENFVNALRQGKMNGAPAGRDILPPMPWKAFHNMTDDELGAIYAYLETTKPIHNAVPPPIAPVK